MQSQKSWQAHQEIRFPLLAHLACIPSGCDSYSRSPITYLKDFAPRQILKAFSLQTNSLVFGSPSALTSISYLLGPAWVGIPARSSAAPNCSLARALREVLAAGEYRKRSRRAVTRIRSSVARSRWRCEVRASQPGMARNAMAQASFFARISPATAGLAFPLESFMTCPLRKLSAASLPAL